MDDDELTQRASMPTLIPNPRHQTPAKIAFMFLTRNSLPLSPLWERFFKNSKNLYSIYIHSDPSFNESAAPDSVFSNRRIPSKRVQWGEASMIEAERRLLANALLDPSNQRFVLLSESCIPLFNFSTTYSYLLNSTLNFVESYDLPGPVGRGRFNPAMAPTIRLHQWRKGSQWFAIDRRLAVRVVSDRVYFPVFQKRCNGQCYSDEHYLPTMVSIRYGAWNSNRSLTSVDWARGGPHPTTFHRPVVTPAFLEGLRSGSQCKYNGKTTNICYLFARKFPIDALDRLLRFAPLVMHFGS